MRCSAGALVLLAFTGSVFAQAAVPHTFAPDTKAKASEVNDNFQALVTAINAGIPGYEIVEQSCTIPSQPSGAPTPTCSSSCPAGKRVLGGGFSGQTLGPPSPNGGVGIVLALSSQPGAAPGQPAGTQWSVQIYNNTNGAHAVVVFAICAFASNNP